jgi:hypothetical protein
MMGNIHSVSDFLWSFNEATKSQATAICFDDIQTQFGESENPARLKEIWHLFLTFSPRVPQEVSFGKVIIMSPLEMLFAFQVR